MMETFCIPYPKTRQGKTAWNRLYGMNAIYAGKHWSRRQQDAKTWHMLTVAAINKAGCRREPFQRPVILTFRWNDRMDCSNHAYLAKLIEDGMRGRLIVDDSRKWVQGIEHYFHDKDCIQVTLRDGGLHDEEI